MRALSLIFILIAGAVQASEAWRDDVIYFVMLDRFADGDITNNQTVDPANPLAFHGGDLKGLAENLDEIADLGATAVWLTPIVKQVDPIQVDEGTFHGHHGYWADSFTELDPRFGTEADLKSLVDRAHALGLKVVLDVVYNHVGYDAEWTRTRPDWLREGEACGGDAITLCLAGLPDLRTDLPEVRAHLFDAHIGLAQRTGLDGFRLDTVKHIEHDFWQAHRDLVRARLGDDFLLLGEVWDADKYLAEPYFANDEMDAITDFAFRDRTLKFLNGVSSAKRYGRYLAARHNVEGDNLLAPFLSNHDMPMLLAMFRGDTERLKLAATLMFTTEGLPVLAWGEAVGRRGGLWPDNREAMAWGDKPVLPGAGLPRDEDLRSQFKALIALRRDLPALTGDQISVVQADQRAFAYTRGENVLVLANAGSDPWVFSADGYAHDDWAQAYATTATAAGFTVPPNAAVILTRVQ